MKGVEEAARQGLQVGIVTNAYWATSTEDAQEWLRPFVGKVVDLSVSSDLYHYNERLSEQAQRATEAAELLGIPTGVISIAQPEETSGELMYRGRAAEKLASKVPGHPWDTFTECSFEDLREPGRVHIDPLGNMHICQGISLGNVFENELKNICGEYDPERHPIVGPLLSGGPAALAELYNIPRKGKYVDACHLCYMTRSVLRDQFPEILTPDQVYGMFG